MKHPFSCANCRHCSGSQCSLHSRALQNTRNEICPDHDIAPADEAPMRRLFCALCNYHLNMDETLCMAVDEPIRQAFPARCPRYAAILRGLEGHTQLNWGDAPAPAGGSASPAASDTSSSTSSLSSLSGSFSKPSAGAAPHRTRAAAPANARPVAPKSAPSSAPAKPVQKSVPSAAPAQSTPAAAAGPTQSRQRDRLKPDDRFFRRLNPSLIISVVLLAIFFGMSIVIHDYHRASATVGFWLLGFLALYSLVCGLVYGVSNRPGNNGWYQILTALMSAVCTLVLLWEGKLGAILVALVLSAIQGALSLALAHLGTWITNKLCKP